jgi:hypothetical protein
MQGAVEFPRPSQSRSEGAGGVDAETKGSGVFSLAPLENLSDNPPSRDVTELLISSIPLTPYALPLTHLAPHPPLTSV